MKTYDVDKLLALWREGILVSEIAQELGVPATTVAKYISRHREVFGFRANLQYKEYDKKELVKMWHEGKKIEEIASKLNVPKSTVSGYVANHRDECPCRIQHSDYDEEEVLKFWNMGMKAKDIAIKLNISDAAVMHCVYSNKERCVSKKINYNNEVIIKLWQKGKKVKEIAEELGIEEYKIASYINSHRNIYGYRYVRSNTNALKISTGRIIMQMWDDKKSIEEIATKLGLEKDAVENYIRMLKSVDTLND